MCGQHGGYGNFDHPFGSERACRVCIQIAYKLIEAREVKLAQPVAIEFTQDQLEELHALINRAQQAYKSDAEYYGYRLAGAAQDDPNRDVIQSNVDYTQRMVNTADTLRALVIASKN